MNLNFRRGACPLSEILNTPAVPYPYPVAYDCCVASRIAYVSGVLR